MEETDINSTSNKDNQKPQVTPSTGSEDDLLNIIKEENPYPKEHVIATLREKTSPANKLKLQKNIKINTRGNVETLGREFMVLSAEANGIDIVKKDGVSYFMGGAAQREAEAQWFSLFDSPEQADVFIEQFTGKDNKRDNKIGNMMRIFGLYGPGKATGQRDPRERKRTNTQQSYATLSKTYGDNMKYLIKCIFSEWQFQAQAIDGYAEHGHPVIVSRPV